MAAQNNAPLPDGLDIAGYRIVKKIASGGFSIVYLAYDGEGNAVAIKEYLPSSLALRQPGEFVPVVAKPHLAVFRIGLKCFFEEGRALARIVHPNVVRVLNFFRAHETVYMVMAYESGQSLQEHVARAASKGTRLSEQFVRQVFHGICAGLREVHANKLLHLDLKPANIYLRTDGSPLLLDFGAARQTIQSDSPMLAPMYTPGFAAPELYTRGASLGPWTDIYSVGASMLACMTCSTPQPIDARRVDDKLPEQLERLSGRYSPELIELVRSCISLDPLVRPQSVFTIQKSLQARPAKRPSTTPPAPPAPTAPPSSPESEARGGWRGLVDRLGALRRGQE